MNQAPPEGISNDLMTGVQEFRGALTELLGETRIETLRPLPLARELGVDKSLAWKVSRIIKADQPAEVFKHLPGSAGLKILLSAAVKRGGTAQTVQRAKAAMVSIDRIVERHVGDRQSLELFLDSAGDSSGGDHLLMSRKLAFRGTSGIWGVQAAARLNTAIVAPSATRPGYIDQASIGCWVDFRRLRSDARWALFRRRTTPGDGNHVAPMPIDPEESPDGPMLIRRFCTQTLPPINLVHEPNGTTVYELAESAVGNTGAFSCVFGSIHQALGHRKAQNPGDHGWFAAVVSAPVEVLQFDILAHKSCAFALDITTNVYGNLTLDSSSRHERDRLPLTIKGVQLGMPAVVDTPLLPGYSEIIDMTMRRGGWDRREFIGVRYTLEYPPFPSTAVLSFPLEAT